MKQYELEFSFIPRIVNLCNEQQIDPQVLLNLEFWKRFLENNNIEIEFSWDEFKVEFQPVDEERAVIFYTFPEPKESPEAKYGAIIVNRNEQVFRYFTFEKEENKWMIGEMTAEHHKVYGFFEENAGIADFLQEILKLT